MMVDIPQNTEGVMISHQIRGGRSAQNTHFLLRRRLFDLILVFYWEVIRKNGTHCHIVEKFP